MTAMAGDLPGFEEALRALFAGQSERFKDLISGWPEDIRTHVLGLVKDTMSTLDGATATEPRPAKL